MGFDSIPLLRAENADKYWTFGEDGKMGFRGNGKALKPLRILIGWARSATPPFATLHFGFAVSSRPSFLRMIAAVRGAAAKLHSRLPFLRPELSPPLPLRPHSLACLGAYGGVNSLGRSKNVKLEIIKFCRKARFVVKLRKSTKEE